MASDVNELSVNYEEDGVLIVKELDKEILSKGAWSTILFRYVQWDKKKEEYSPDRFVIRRYRKKKRRVSDAGQIYHFQCRTGPEADWRSAELGGRKVMAL